MRYRPPKKPADYQVTTKKGYVLSLNIISQDCYEVTREHQDDRIKYELGFKTLENAMSFLSAQAENDGGPIDLPPADGARSGSK